jgi:hypothetical protein
MKAILRFIFSLFESESSSVEYRKIEPTLRFDLSKVNELTHEFVRHGLLDIKTKKLFSSAYYEIYNGSEKGVLIEIGNLQKIFIKARHIKNFPSS